MQKTAGRKNWIFCKTESYIKWQVQILQHNHRRSMELIMINTENQLPCSKSVTYKFCHSGLSRIFFRKKDSEQVGMTKTQQRRYHMKRRDFLIILLLGSFFSPFGKKVRAEKKPENNLKEAMFWRKTD